MARGKKRSRADRKAPMTDMPAPKALTFGNSSSRPEFQPDNSSPGEVLDPLSSHHTLRRPAAIAASSAIAKAALYHDESDEEVETKRRNKKVTVIEETKAIIPDGYAPTSHPSAPSGSPNVKMTEVRARAARHKGQMNFEAESMSKAYAFKVYSLLTSSSNSGPLRVRRRQRTLAGDCPHPGRNGHRLHHRNLLRCRQVRRMLRSLEAQGR